MIDYPYPELYKKVKQAFVNACENGYDLRKDMLIRDIANDMRDCDSDLENENYDLILNCLIHMFMWEGDTIYDPNS